MFILEIAERWGYKPAEIMEMDSKEFLLLVEYQTRRPQGMYDDIRAYRQIQLTSMSDKLPEMQELFPSVSILLKELKTSEKVRVQQIDKDPFIAFLRRKGQESGENILVLEDK